MALTKNELNEALDRAKYLMSPEGQRQIDFAGKANVNNFDINGDFKQTQSFAPKKYNTTSIGSSQKSKLPKAIQEAMNRNPIDYDGTLTDLEETSILDKIGYKPQPKENIKEEKFVPYQPTQTTQQYVQQPMMLNIDYNYIKHIVNECIKENLQEIKNELLKENTLKTIRLGGENKIQLIDNKNNLYESKLEFKKNLVKK